MNRKRLMSVLVYFNKFTIISYVLSSNEQFHTNDPNINHYSRSDIVIPITGNFVLTYLNDRYLKTRTIILIFRVYCTYPLLVRCKVHSTDVRSLLVNPITTNNSGSYNS